MSNLGMYSGGFVVNILVNNNMQHVSQDGIITIPFGSEYKIRLQNKNIRRAVAKVFIDDENVSGGGFVINSYSQVDIERPANDDKAYKFKFVSLDSGQAADAGKSHNSNGEKGVIRVEFQLEKEVVAYKQPVAPHNPWRKDFTPSWNHRASEPFTEEVFTEYEEKTCGGINLPDTKCSARSRSSSKSLGEVGATVSGGHSNQSFYTVNIEVDNRPPVVLTVVLRGWDESTLPIVGGSCVYCSSCGKKANKSTDKFCSRCGKKF